MAAVQVELRESGVERIGRIPWGTHVCQFYQDKEDLLEILVPYFRAGLQANEYCMWVTADCLEVAEARAALLSVIPDLEERHRLGQIDIIPHDEWYLIDRRFDAQRIIRGWELCIERARSRGYSGIRVTGDMARWEKTAWGDFAEYEAAIGKRIGNLRMIAICTYALGLCGGPEVLSALDMHRLALVRSGTQWETVERIDQRKLAETLSEDGRRLRLLFDHMGTGCAYHQVVFSDGRPVDYIFLEANPAFERLTGLRRESIIGRRVTDVIPGIRDDEFDWIGIYGRVAISGEPAHFERRADPLGRWYSVSAYSPSPGYFVAVFEDVTERRRAEEQREDLLRAVTHDLRTPLSVISLAAEAMTRSPGGAPPREALDSISRSCRHMQAMLQDLADATRLDGGPVRLERQKIDLARFILETVRRLRGVLDLSRIQIRMERDVAAVDADPDRLERVVTNLLTNAIKYSPADRPVRIAVHAAGAFSRITIEDEGPGIAPEDLPHIFDRFYRAKSALRVDGLGLGLYIARAFTEAHGGRIAVVSRPGFGSQFDVDIPCEAGT